MWNMYNESFKKLRSWVNFSDDGFVFKDFVHNFTEILKFFVTNIVQFWFHFVRRIWEKSLIPKRKISIIFDYDLIFVHFQEFLQFIEFYEEGGVAQKKTFTQKMLFVMFIMNLQSAKVFIKK